MTNQLTHKRNGGSIFLMLCLNLGLNPAFAVEVGGPKTTPQQSKTCEQMQISCVDPHACCPESKKVIDTLNLLVKAYSSGDLKTYEEYLDDNCTTFDESTHRLVSGKQHVLNELKEKFAKHGPQGEQPLKSFTIDQPFAKVEGDTCVVSFFAYRELGGAHPVKQKSFITDVFVKHGDKWKKLHYRGSWKKA